MRFLVYCVSLALLAGAGCFHKRAAAPRDNFSEIPGLPKTPEPVPVEVKQKSKPQKKEVKAEVIQATAADVNHNKQLATRTGLENRPAPEPVPPPAGLKTPKLIVTPENGLAGKVEMVNQNARYVVLSFPIGHLPAMEQRLNVYRNGLKVGEVKVSGPQIEDNVVADIVEGESGQGDEVRDK
jgi:hypothetical protein